MKQGNRKMWDEPSHKVVITLPESLYQLIKTGLVPGDTVPAYIRRLLGKIFAPSGWVGGEKTDV